MSDFARGLRSLDSVFKRLLGDEWRPEDDSAPKTYDVGNDIELLDFTHGDTLPAVEDEPREHGHACDCDLCATEPDEPGLGEGSIFDRYHS